MHTAETASYPAAFACSSVSPVRPPFNVGSRRTTPVPRQPPYPFPAPYRLFAIARAARFAVEPIADHCGCPVSEFFTIAQSPAAYTSGRLVFMFSSTRIVPFIISMPEPERKLVAGRTPMARIIRSAGSAPLSVEMLSACSVPLIPFRLTEVSTRMPPAFSLRLAYPAISASKALGIIWGAASITVTSMPSAARFSAVSRPINPAPQTAAFRQLFFSA